MRIVHAFLLFRFLKCSPDFEAAETLRCFALRYPPAPESHRRGLHPTRPDVKFANGESGGLAAVATDEADENFNVGDDERAIAIVDLVEEDSRMGVKFFLALLKVS